jgi:hypothetical protein
MKNLSTTIGLFGTCGNSKWRDNFISAYEKNGINYYNPLEADRNPTLAQIEAIHLVSDDIILFPVTDETYGVGSLAEIGFSILSSLQWESNRHIIIFIDPKIDESKLTTVDKQAVKDSNNARALVSEHLKKHKSSNVHVVSSLTDMLTLSIVLIAGISLLKNAHKFLLPED